MQTRDRPIVLSVDAAVAALGIEAAYLDVVGLRNREGDPEFEAYKKQLAKRLRTQYTEDFIRTDPILEGFRELRRRIGRSVRKYPASTESLVGFLRRTGKIPSINLAVDLYNVVSLETRLTLGAHDGAKVAGDIRLKLATGDEHFLPLGSTKSERVAAGDYCYVDSDDEVLCRLDYRQADRTKITPATSHGFFIIQGNPATSRDQLAAAADRLAGLLRTYCSDADTYIRTAAG
jgi:DNA/RNA-binding domain of Phe-tRNA-synthetase-like protein